MQVSQEPVLTVCLLRVPVLQVQASQGGLGTGLEVLLWQVRR